MTVFLVTQTEDLKTKKREREELGVQLYGVQQELARQQMLLEKEHDNFNSENQLRLQCEKLLEETKDLHDKTSEDRNHQRKQGTEHCYNKLLLLIVSVFVTVVHNFYLFWESFYLIYYSMQYCMYDQQLQ